MADAAHNSVAAHWVASTPAGEVGGTYVFRFCPESGQVVEITGYVDEAEEEFLDA